MSNNIRKMSPWGKVQSQAVLAPGIICCSAAGHGGIWIDQKHQRKIKIKSKFLGSKTWWEEDQDWAAPYYYFFDEIKNYNTDRDEEVMFKNYQIAKEIVLSKYPEIV